MRKSMVLLVLFLLVVIGVYTFSKMNVDLVVDDHQYSIPSEFIPKTNRLKIFESSNFDDVGMELSLVFSNEFLSNLYSEYKSYQGLHDAPTFFMVSVYDARNVGNSDSEPYQDILSLKGEFIDAKISKDDGVQYYKISRKGDDLGQWFYTTSDPRVSHLENNIVIAVCHGILPAKGISRCSASVRVDGLFLQVSFSHINIGLVDQFSELMKSKFSEWKIK